MEEAQEDVRESQGEANQTEPPQDDRLSQSSDRRSRQRTRERSRERERSVGRDLSRLRKSRRRHESLPRRSAGRRLSGDSRRRDDRRSVEWNDLVPLHKRNPQHRYARSGERKQSSRRDAERRGRTRSRTRAPRGRSFNHDGRGATLMDIIRKRIARRSSGRNLGRASNTAAPRSPPSIRVDQPGRRRSRRSARLCDR